MPRAKTARLNLRISPDLAKDIKGYAERRGLSLTSLVELHFRQVLEVEAAASNTPIDAEQV